MAFTIPDNDEAFNANQSIWFQTDINALVAGVGGDGVVSGCAVTAQGSPDMTVAVAAGVVNIAGASVTVTSGNVTITTANGSNPRIDLVVVSNAGVKSVTAGTAAANPKAPDIPANSVLLAMVYVPTSDTTIASNQIIDKRTIIRELIAEGRFIASGTTHLTLPGVVPAQTPSGVTTFGLTGGYLHYMPILVSTPITLDRLVAEITTAAGAGNNMRMGIYNAGLDWQPTTLLVDGGEVAIDANAVVAATISQILTPGRYILASLPQASCSVRGIYGGGNLIGYNATLGANPFITELYAAQAYGALPSTGPAGTAGLGTGGLIYHVLCRVSVA